MSAADCFLDTNVLLYLLSKDAAKADRAEALLATGGIVSVQVLNEFASVATRKLAMTIAGNSRNSVNDPSGLCRQIIGH
jgi:predicted nucleic acid-binding protein